jgi:GNAT superfamily N-acetyltransferase
LLAAAEDWARRRGLNALEVTVWGFNVAAQDLYRTVGFDVLRHYLRKPLVG